MGETRASSRVSGAETAGQMMRRHFISVSPDDSLLEAAQLMRIARVRTLPVTVNGVLLGLLNHREILGALLSRVDHSAERPGIETLDGLCVHELTIQGGGGVAPDTPLALAVAQLCELHSGCIPVVEDSPEGVPRIVGLLTEGDLLRAAYDVRGGGDGSSSS